MRTSPRLSRVQYINDSFHLETCRIKVVVRKIRKAVKHGFSVCTYIKKNPPHVLENSDRNKNSLSIPHSQPPGPNTKQNHKSLSLSPLPPCLPHLHSYKFEKKSKKAKETLKKERGKKAFTDRIQI